MREFKLLAAQCRYGIDAHRPPCRKESSRQGDEPPAEV